MVVHEAGENYLEAILVESQRLGEGNVRSIDICNALGYSKPTISVMMKNFRKDGLITMDDAGMIRLTDSGRKIAEKIYERHRVISDFLITLGVSEETAREDACKIEHDISEESFNCLKKHINKYKKQSE